MLSRFQSPQAVLVSLLWQWLIGVLMKPSFQNPDQSHLISCRAYRSVLAVRHSLEHSSRVHRQVFQRYEWLVFVSANWGLIFTWPRLVFFEGVYLGLPHVEPLLKCDTPVGSWGGLHLMQKPVLNAKMFPLNQKFTFTTVNYDLMWPEWDKCYFHYWEM